MSLCLRERLSPRRATSKVASPTRRARSEAWQGRDAEISREKRKLLKDFFTQLGLGASAREVCRRKKSEIREPDNNGVHCYECSNLRIQDEGEMCWPECASLSGILDNGCMVKGEQKGTDELGYLRPKRILGQ